MLITILIYIENAGEASTRTGQTTREEEDDVHGRRRRTTATEERGGQQRVLRVGTDHEEDAHGDGQDDEGHD